MRALCTIALLAIVLTTPTLIAQRISDQDRVSDGRAASRPELPMATTGSQRALATEEIVWAPLGTGVTGEVMRMAHLNGQLHVWQELPRTGPTYSEMISRWNGTRWDSVLRIDQGSGRRTLFAEYGSKLYFYGSTADRFMRLYAWNGASLDTISVISDMFLSIFKGSVFRDDLYIGGTFKNLNHIAGANNIARWDGSQWHALGEGIDNREQIGGRDSNNAQVISMAEYKGQLFVGGIFSHAGGAESPYLAIWNGSSWEKGADGGPSGEVDLMDADDSLLYVSSSDGQVMTWDGASWHGIPFCPIFSITDMVVYKHRLYVSGMSNGAYSIARWNGAEWETFQGFDPNPGPEPDSYSGCLLEHEGSLVAGGNFVSSGGITLNNIARTDLQSLGVPSASATSSTTIFPNPTGGAVRIEARMPMGGTISVLDMLGRPRMRFPVLNGRSQMIDLSALPAGSYILALPTTDGPTIRQVTLVR